MSEKARDCRLAITDCRLSRLGAWPVLVVALCLPVWGEVTSRPDPDLKRQREICFPTEAGKKVRTWRGDGVVLWSDAPIDGQAVVTELVTARQYLAALLPRPLSRSRPATQPTARPVALAVYARSDDYRKLWRRVGEHYGGLLPAITTEGYSYRVFCATSFDGPKRFAARGAVLCHEFAHVWLYTHRGLANDGNWLTEGLAGAVQLRLHPASGDRRQFARWLAAGRMLPLKRLMDLKRIAPKDYWQAATLIEYLAETHGEKLPAVVAAFNKGRSANAIVTEVLATDFVSLTRGWAGYVKRQAAAVEARGAGGIQHDSASSAPSPGAVVCHRL